MIMASLHEALTVTKGNLIKVLSITAHHDNL